MGAKLRNCQRCGKLFTSNNNEKICRDCMDAQADLEAEVIAFVKNNPGCTITDIEEGTGADEKLIRHLMDTGRFTQMGGLVAYPCKKCGKPIVAGQFCGDCLSAMQANIKSVQSKISFTAEKKDTPARHGMRSRNLQTPN